jgi:hypothetical protein
MESPNYLPLDVACAVGLIVSGTVSSPFKNNVITFNDTPEFVLIDDGDIDKRYFQLRHINWGGSTNIKATFEMILSRGKAAGLKNEQMPKRIIIVSDMQFNTVEGRNSTNFEEIDRMYMESDYDRPTIVFWNVNGNTDDFPVTVDDNNTAMISGFSPSILKSVMNTKEFSPYSIMRETLDDERYSNVRENVMN